MCRNNETIDTSIVRNYQFNFVWKYTKLIGFSFLQRNIFCKKNKIITYFVFDKWEFVLRMFMVLRPRIIHWKSAAFSLISSLLFKDCRLKVRISPFQYDNLTWTWCFFFCFCICMIWFQLTNVTHYLTLMKV